MLPLDLMRRPARSGGGHCLLSSSLDNHASSAFTRRGGGWIARSCRHAGSGCHSRISVLAPGLVRCWFCRYSALVFVRGVLDCSLRWSATPARLVTPFSMCEHLQQIILFFLHVVLIGFLFLLWCEMVCIWDVNNVAWFHNMS